MSYSFLEFLLVGVAAIALSGLLTPIFRRLAFHVGATDNPDLQRKTQKQPVPYLGGVAVSVTVVTLSFLTLSFSDFTQQNLSLAASTMLPAIAISAMGLVDDLRGLQPWPRLLIQSATAFLVSIILINSGTLGQSLGSTRLDFIFTTLWIVGLCNSINFFDNLDGGASGAVAIISFSIFLIAVDRGQFLVSGLAIITAGATLGFLMWNKFPAKIYLGGVAVSVTVVTLSFLVLFLSDFTKQTVSLATSTMLPAMAISALGLIDDLRGLQPWPRLMIQSATAFLVSIVLINSGTLGQSFGSDWLDFLITALWIVGLCNSINFFDNLDGGASGAVAIISFSIFIIAVDRGQFLVSGLAIITAGATLGFLMWNKFPAKIYLGDAGALFLGVMIAILTIRMDPGIAPTYKSLLIPVIFLAVPILDTSVAVTSRIYRGISPFTGGRDHLSHRLMRVGLTQKNAAISLWAATSVFCAAGLGIYYWPDTFGLPLIIGAGATWTALLAWFLRVPAKD